MFQEGLRGTLRIAVISVVASTLIGVVLGTVLTIRFAPTRMLIRAYIEVWRGLPMIVTLFMIFFLGPLIADQFEFDPFTAATIGLTLWVSAQVADAPRRAVDPARAARGGRRARLRLGRQARVRHPPAGSAASDPAARQLARRHHPELDARAGDRGKRAARVRGALRRAPGRAAAVG